MLLILSLIIFKVGWTQPTTSIPSGTSITNPIILEPLYYASFEVPTPSDVSTCYDSPFTIQNYSLLTGAASSPAIGGGALSIVPTSGNPHPKILDVANTITSGTTTTSYPSLYAWSTTEISYEFFFRIPSNYTGGALINQNSGPVGVTLTSSKLEVFATLKNSATPTTSTIAYKLKVNLTGIDRSSFGYYADNQWHHIGVTFNTNPPSSPNVPLIRLYVDGYLLATENTPIAGTKAVPPYYFNTASSGTEFANELAFDPADKNIEYDEIIVYPLDLGDDACSYFLSHFETMQNQDNTPPISYPADYLVFPTSTTCIPPGTIQQTGTISSDELSSGIAEDLALSLFPDPRYVYDHSFLRNFPWFILHQNGSDPASSTNCLSDLSKTFNYSYLLANNASTQIWGLTSSGGTTQNSYLDTSPTTGYVSDWIAGAIADNTCPTAAITFWNNANPERSTFQYGTTYSPTLSDAVSSIPYLRRNDLTPVDNYFHDNLNAPVLWGAGRQWSFASGTDGPTWDGQATNSNLDQLAALTGRGIDQIGENGEERPVTNNYRDGYTVLPCSTVLATDPNIASDCASWKGSACSCSDWDKYTSVRKKDLRVAYRDALLFNHPNTSVTGTTRFSWYEVGGEFPSTHYLYSELDEVLPSYSHPAGGSYRYPTPKFYPQYAQYWLTKPYGALSGFEQITDARKVEIDNGDTYFAPFVSPGINDGTSKWTAKTTTRLLPGQYLALLKHMGTFGAEYFHTFWYYVNNDGATTNSNRAQETIYEAVMPSYAQAVLSKAEDLFRNSELLIGDFSSNCATPSYRFTTSSYGGSSAGVMDVVTVRTNPSKTQFLISGSIQRNGNTQAGNLSKMVTISLSDNTCPGQQPINWPSGGGQISLSFEIRSQGSTYFFDATTGEFYQLDGWHEWKHPIYWSKDIYLEAELYDAISDANSVGSEAIIKTEVPSPPANGDYTSFTTSVSMSQSPNYPNIPCLAAENAGFDYYFNIRDLETTANPENQSTMDFYFKVRNSGPVSGFTADLYEVTDACGGDLTPNSTRILRWSNGAINSSQFGSGFNWVNVDEWGSPFSYSFSTKGRYMIRFIPWSKDIELDAILLESNGTTPSPTPIVPVLQSSSTSISMTANPSTICEGETVIFDIASDYFGTCIPASIDPGDGTGTFYSSSTSHTYLTAGTYYPSFTGTYGGNAYTCSTTVVVTPGPCSIRSAATAPEASDQMNLLGSNVRVYPNPSQGQFKIEVTSPKSGSMKAEISTLLGQKVFESDIKVSEGINDYDIDLSKASHGLYNLKLSIDGHPFKVFQIAIQ